jgi:preprotein translocase subunit YajC
MKEMIWLSVILILCFLFIYYKVSKSLHWIWKARQEMNKELRKVGKILLIRGGLCKGDKVLLKHGGLIKKDTEARVFLCYEEYFIPEVRLFGFLPIWYSVYGDWWYSDENVTWERRSNSNKGFPPSQTQ